jgi:hypothetical protein
MINRHFLSQLPGLELFRHLFFVVVVFGYDLTWASSFSVGKDSVYISRDTTTLRKVSSSPIPARYNDYARLIQFNRDSLICVY